MRTLFQVHPLVFTWPYAAIFSVVTLWMFIPERRLMKRARQSAGTRGSDDRGSLRVILAGGQTAMVAAVVVSGLGPTVMPLAYRAWYFWTGLALVVAGSALRRHCFRVLGEHFTGDVRVRAEQPVVDRGAYRWVRHPSYTAGFLIFGGIGLALGNWLSFGLMFGMTAATYAYRVRVEEQALLRTIGEPYRRFMKTRKRFIPFVI